MLHKYFRIPAQARTEKHQLQRKVKSFHNYYPGLDLFNVPVRFKRDIPEMVLTTKKSEPEIAVFQSAFKIHVLYEFKFQWGPNERSETE